jgi:hypothetical protein
MHQAPDSQTHAPTALLQTRRQVRLWRGTVVPLLAVVLVFEYAVFLGPPPIGGAPPPLAAHGDGGSSGGGSGGGGGGGALRLLLRWLGAVDVRAPAVWALAVAFGLCTQQAHWDRKARVAAAGRGARGGGPDPTEALWRRWEGLPRRGPGWWGRSGEEGEGDVEQPLLGGASGPGSDADAEATPDAAAADAAAADASGNHAAPAAGAAEGKPGGGAVASTASSGGGWAERARFEVSKHSIDLVLVATVASCALQRDVVHGGYLALGLFGFRQRRRLAAPGGSALFRALLRFNVAAIALTLVYQVRQAFCLKTREGGPAFGLFAGTPLHGPQLRADPSLRTHPSRRRGSCCWGPPGPTPASWARPRAARRRS